VKPDGIIANETPALKRTGKNEKLKEVKKIGRRVKNEKVARKKTEKGDIQIPPGATLSHYTAEFTWLYYLF